MKKKLTLLLLVTIFVSGLVTVLVFSKTNPPVRQNAEDSRGSTFSSMSEYSKPLYDDKLDLHNLVLSEFTGYKNLQVAIVYGSAAINKKYVTLENALSKKLVELHETGSVNQLEIDNNSGEYIYINSGDIVKGGKQDRTIQYDVILAPKSKNIDLASFCVEHGRWNSRGSESSSYFSSSSNSLSSKDLKLAAKYKKSQTDVWDKVGKYQDKANESVKETLEDTTVEVRSSVSSTSLELTLDNESIKKLKAQYRKYFDEHLKMPVKSIGFAYFINGKFVSMDVYNNEQLFNNVFNKLLDAAIAEAISEANDKKKFPDADRNVAVQLLKADAKVYQEEDVNEETRFITAEHNQLKNIVIFTTIDKEQDLWLHRNWMDKSE